MNGRSRLLALGIILATALVPGLVRAQESMRLEKQFAAGELSTPVVSMQFSLFGSSEADVPLASQTYFPGEWQISSNASSHQVSVNFAETAALPEQGELWLEVESDGILVGERELIRAVAPGVTFALGNALDMSTNLITNLGTPQAGTDAATMQYVLDQVATVTGDDMGDHSATENILLNGFWLSPDGTNAGLFIDPAGQVGIGMDTPAHSLDVLGSINASTAVKINGTDVLTSESDPKIGTLTADKWCSSDGLVVNCDADLPGPTETDPTVPETIKDGIDWTELSGIPAGFADNTDNIGLTIETDPTVPAAIKDGIDWTELSGIPAGFADDVDDVGLTSEDDPEVGTNTTNYVPVWDGSALATGTLWDNGKIGIGTETPAANLQVDGVDGVLFEDTVGGGAIPVEGPGTRMMWYPGKGAFRAGSLNNGVYWEDANTGVNSVAMGYNTRASGIDSVALGSSSDATGDQSVALGNNATASGANTFAVGWGSHADGAHSRTLGFAVKAFSGNEVVLGAMNTLYTPVAPDGWDELDRLFVVGNGSPSKGKSDALVILKNGKVGLGGNATPAYMLDVTGDINASGAIKINGTDVLTAFSETDPTFGSLTANKWCVADGTGTLVNCTADQPVLSESDPTITDPSIKDGVSWSELSGIPTDFSDNVDDQGVTSVASGTGLTGGPITTTGTLSIQVPLTLDGAHTSAIFTGINTGAGYGVEGRGASGGGLFRQLDGSSSVELGSGGRGVTSYGTVKGGHFADGDDSGYADVGVGDYGIKAYGDSAGGLFVDLDNTSTATLATSGWGIYASGDDVGGHFESSSDSGYADVGIGDFGIKAYGDLAGGYFGDLNNTGYAELGVGNAGVLGYGTTFGGYFEDTDSTGIARLAFNDVGVDGRAATSAGYFLNTQSSGSEVYIGQRSIGVNASASSTGAIGVRGVSTYTGGEIDRGGYFSAAGAAGLGVEGKATATGAVSNVGGKFSASGDLGIAVEGAAWATGDVTNYGGFFLSASNLGVGVRGVATFGNAGTGVVGEGTSRGVEGTGSTGVYGIGTGATDETGVYGQAAGRVGGNHYGVRGYVYIAGGVDPATANIYGVHGRATGFSTTGVKYAGYFSGDTHVTGTLSKGGGSFKIDHPLDPENRTLSHSFVESPDMMNVYNGNVVLDANGEAFVEMPEWFEVLNRDFRYQLTTIGGFAPVYVSEEVQENSFRIAGGTAGLKVSWQVTGIRQDPFAERNRIPVDEDKPDNERGSYLHPASYDMPEERSVEWARDPKGMAELKAAETR